MAPEQTECAGHTDFAGEFRQLGRTALDRLEPWLEQVRVRADTRAPGASGADVDADEHTASVAAACAVCPICAVIALVRGERSELAVRLSEQASGLLTVLRTALDEGSSAPAGAAVPSSSGATEPPPAGGRAVQHIPVVRTDRPPAGC